MNYTCFTNLDSYKTVEWPTAFVFPPRIGDRVEGRRGESGLGSRPSLKVVSITHRMTKNRYGEMIPTIAIELHH